MKHIEELQKNNIIEQCCSPYNSNIVVVRKKDGKIRMAVDYRDLNKIIADIAFPSPNLEEEIYSFSGKKIFSNVDMTSGFYQLKLAVASRNCTAFSICGKQYRFCRVPFVIKVSPALFQQQIRRKLNKLAHTQSL